MNKLPLSRIIQINWIKAPRKMLHCLVYKYNTHVINTATEKHPEMFGAVTEERKTLAVVITL